jgi:hypothetical protein
MLAASPSAMLAGVAPLWSIPLVGFIVAVHRPDERTVLVQSQKRADGQIPQKATACEVLMGTLVQLALLGGSCTVIFQQVKQVGIIAYRRVAVRPLRAWHAAR